MSRDEFEFQSSDGIEVAYYRWRAAGKPAGIVQIAHGMGEHALRYEPLAAFLNASGFHVFANDHRGHGRTAKGPEALGDFGAGGWNALVEDMASLSKLALMREGKLPLVLIGHSMGSFAAQQYLIEHSELIAAAVISGSAAIDMLPIDPSAEADLTAFNQPFEPARTPYDWLSRDAKQVDAYVADPLCGFGVNKRSMAGMAGAAKQLSDPAQLAHIRKDLPIYIVAGDMDPINHGLEWLKPLADRYRAAGINNVTERYYEGGRHEMLNETNRDEVMRDLLEWMRKAIAG